MLVSYVERERVIEELDHYNPEVLETNLSPEDEDELRHHFAADEVAV